MLKRTYDNSRKQRGQVLIIVLALLALGGVTIASSLNYSTTILKENRILTNKMDGVYAAGSGVEYAIWALENGEEIPELLSDNVNGMTVYIDEVDHGIFTLYCGELSYVGDLPMHYDWMSVNSSAVCAGGTCNYTIIVQWYGTAEQRRMVELGTTLPPGYTYIEGSAAEFEDNITNDDPDETGETQGGSQWIKWLWSPGHGPVISSENATQTETFTISGSGEIEGDYCWVAVQSQDIGLVGEITGQRYTITGNATGPGMGNSLVEADIMIVGGTVYITSWRIVR